MNISRVEKLLSSKSRLCHSALLSGCTGTRRPQVRRSWVLPCYNSFACSLETSTGLCGYPSDKLKHLDLPQLQGLPFQSWLSRSGLQIFPSPGNPPLSKLQLCIELSHKHVILLPQYTIIKTWLRTQENTLMFKSDWLILFPNLISLKVGSWE